MFKRLLVYWLYNKEVKREPLHAFGYIRMTPVLAGTKEHDHVCRSDAVDGYIQEMRARGY
jgi:hypothetical protein